MKRESLSVLERFRRIILHCDVNHCYAAISCLYNPDIRNLPVVVGGSTEERHGIVLTKNPIAKRFGIITGETILEALRKCPNLTVVPPDYDLYKRFSVAMRTLLYEYSNRIESYGLDEAWVDLSGPEMTIGEGERIANEIRYRIRRELGVTVSIGVSFCKVYAKLGSDFKKPDATTVISQENHKEVVWPLSVNELLFIGDATTVKLAQLGIHTLGQLAQASEELLLRKLGKLGLMRKADALGLDLSPVKPCEVDVPAKSVGNSSTARHDIENHDHARCMLFILSESVGTRLRAGGYLGRCISISARDKNLVTTSRQLTLKNPTNLTVEIAHHAIRLFERSYGNSYPFRSIGISVSALLPDSNPQQLDLFQDHVRRERIRRGHEAVDSLCERWPGIIRLGTSLLDSELAQTDPLKHDVHPVPIYTG